MYDPQQHTLSNWLRLLYLQFMALYYSEDYTLDPVDVRLEVSSHAFYLMLTTKNYLTEANPG